MPTKGETFKASLGKWANKTQAQLDALARQSSQEVAKAVVIATPVDTGFLRGSWQPSVGGDAKLADPENVMLDAGGANAASMIALEIAQMKAGDVFHMRNNCAYARRLEYGFVGQDSLGRTYNQAGRYYVSDTVKSWRAIVQKVVADLKL